MKTSPRSEKIGHLIQKTLPVLIQRFTSPDKVGMVTVTQVIVSGDLKYADVYVTSVGTSKPFIPFLEKICPKISYELTQMISLRRPVILRFKKDTTDTLFQKIKSYE